jgi:amino acid transporter
LQLNSIDYRLNGHHGRQGNGSAIQSTPSGNLSDASSTQSLTALIPDESSGSGLDTSSDEPVVKQLNRSNTTKDYEHLKFTFVQAVALNTLNMFGTGPFITLPLLISSSDPKGPHALIGYSIAGLISMFDSTVWGELGSLMPYSGATYVYLREAYGRETWGRFMSFMFIWQFLLSGPLEIASGFIAMAQYLGYIFEMNFWQTSLLGCLFCLISVGILHGDINAVSKWTVGLWLVTIGAILSTLVSGFVYFDPNNLKSPPDAFSNMGTLIVSLGTAARIGLYDFSGYQDVCMIGDEVKDAKRNIPRSCVITCVVVTVVYLAVYLAVLGYLPWDGPDGTYLSSLN